MSIDVSLLSGSINPLNIFKTLKYNIEFQKTHPNYFYNDGILVFCGSQGNGKTLSAVQYTVKCLDNYYNCILVTNVEITEFPINCTYKRFSIIDNDIEKTIVEFYTLNRRSLVRRVTSWYEKGEQRVNIEKYDVIDADYNGRIVIEYNGLDTLKDIENGEEGVIYLIDEIHLELNSLESKNISIEVMTELSQQRKQRKHIVGTSQVYLRMAKPLREQIKNVVLCRNFFKFLQFNKLIDGETSHEENGKLVFDTQKHIIWFHSPKLYKMYDTYKKMRRYSNEWQGQSAINLYDNSPSVVINNDVHD